MTDWKQKHANESDKTLAHEIVRGVIDELMGNLSMFGIKNDDALVRLGLNKVAMYAAQVSRAQALGFDPNTLRMTPDEANEALIRQAERIVLSGGDVIVIENPGV